MARRRSKKGGEAALVLLVLVIGAIGLVLKVIADVVQSLGPWLILLLAAAVGVLVWVARARRRRVVPPPSRPVQPESPVMKLTMTGTNAPRDA